MSKLKEKELLELLVIAVQNSIEYFVIEDSEFKERIPELQQFYVQIKEMIQSRAEQEEIEVRYMEIILDLYDRLEKKKPEIKEELIRKIARRIVEKVFRREYTTDNSQTQRIIKQMLKEAGVKVVRK